MRLTRKEKERLYDLMDVMTNRCPQLWINDFVNETDLKLFWGIFKKLRADIR